MSRRVIAGIWRLRGLCAPLFDIRKGAKRVRNYQVSPDGKRFLMPVIRDTAAGPQLFVLVTNWPALLKK